MFAHLYGRPRAPIERILLLAFYLVPSDRTVSSGWDAKIRDLLNNLVPFHEREFDHLSQLFPALHPTPVIGKRTIEQYRAMRDGSHYLHDMTEQVRTLQAPLPQYDFSCYLIFADWGLEARP